MQRNAVTVATAASELGVSASQVRRWIAAGAPVVRDRKPRLVDVDELRRWRQGAHGDALAKIEAALLDTLRRDCGLGAAAHDVLGIDDGRAALLLLSVYDRLHHAITGRDPEPPFSPTIETMRAFVRERAPNAR